MKEDNNSEELKASEDNAGEYENIECNEEKVQPITGSILLSTLKGNPPTSTQASNKESGNEIDSQEVSGGAKSKRRSKNVVEGRMFKCQHCEKTYLSYPALYTHMKTKHSVPLEQTSMVNGRSRGRPKKVG